MSTLKVDVLESKGGNDITINSNDALLVDNLKSTDKTATFIKDGVVQNNSRLPGDVVQKTMRMITQDYTYSTGGAQSRNFAHLAIMDTTITTKEAYSVLYARFGLNGEPGSTHDWTMFPVVKIGNGSYQLHAPGARHHMDGSFGTYAYLEYCSGFTNPGNYDESDRDSTPIQTATMEFMYFPDKPKGTQVTFGIYMQSSGNHTWYLNRCVNSSTNGHYERGVSYICVEEISSGQDRTKVKFEDDNNGNYTYTIG